MCLLVCVYSHITWRTFVRRIPRGLRMHFFRSAGTSILPALPATNTQQFNEHFHTALCRTSGISSMECACSRQLSTVLPRHNESDENGNTSTRALDNPRRKSPSESGVGQRSVCEAGDLYQLDFYVCFRGVVISSILLHAMFASCLFCLVACFV